MYIFNKRIKFCCAPAKKRPHFIRPPKPLSISLEDHYWLSTVVAVTNIEIRTPHLHIWRAYIESQKYKKKWIANGSNIAKMVCIRKWWREECRASAFLLPIYRNTLICAIKTSWKYHGWQNARGDVFVSTFPRSLSCFNAYLYFGRDSRTSKSVYMRLLAVLKETVLFLYINKINMPSHCVPLVLDIQ